MLRSTFKEVARTFDLRGRTTRPDYLWFLLFSILSLTLAIWLCLTLLPQEQFGTSVCILVAVFYLPVTASGVRRLHDVGESGLHMLQPLKPVTALTLIVLTIQFILSATFAGAMAGVIAALFFGTAFILLAYIAALIATLMTLAYFSTTMGLLLLPSAPGPNKYGPNPNEVPS